MRRETKMEKAREGWERGERGNWRGGGGELKQMALLASTSLLNLFLLFFSCARGFNPVVTCVPA